MTETFYVTTPIYYVNGAPHIGHAYTTVAADVLARWMRLEGRAVFFLTGTDEHGQKVAKAAAEAGQDPQAFVDGLAAQFQDMTRRMNTSNDDFIRTTEARHRAGCAALWQVLADRGEIYLGHYEGWYALRDEAFYGEDEVLTRPDGTRVSPFGSPVEWVREPNYLFRLSAWEDRLLAFYDAHPDFLGPAVHPQRDHQLRPRRPERPVGQPRRPELGRAGAGRPVAGDVRVARRAGQLHHRARLPGHLRRTLGLLAGGHPLRRQGHRALPHRVLAGLPDGGRPARAEAGVRQRLVDGRGREDEQVGRQRGRPADLADEFGLDPLRYFLLREMPFGNDGDFNRRAIIARMNSELANDLGNLAQRSLSLIARNCGGQLPERGAHSEDDAEMLAQAAALPDAMRPKLLRQAYGEALDEAWRVIRCANAYIDRQAPWALRRRIPPGWPPCCACWPTCCVRWPPCCSRSCPAAWRRCWTSSACPPTARSLAALGDAAAGRHRAAAAAGHLPALRRRRRPEPC